MPAAVLVRRHRADEREIVGLGGTRRKPKRIGPDSDTVGDLRARGFDAGPGAAPGRMGRRGIGSVAPHAQAFSHCRDHAVVHGGRRRVVEIDFAVRHLMLPDLPRQRRERAAQYIHLVPVQAAALKDAAQAQFELP